MGEPDRRSLREPFHERVKDWSFGQWCQAHLPDLAWCRSMSPQVEQPEDEVRDWWMGQSAIQRDPFEVLFGVRRADAGLPPSAPRLTIEERLTISAGACGLYCYGVGYQGGQFFWYEGPAAGGSLGITIGLATTSVDERSCEQTGGSLATTAGGYLQAGKASGQASAGGADWEAGIMVGVGATLFHHYRIHGGPCP